MTHFIAADLEESWIHDVIDRITRYLTAYAEFVRLYGE